MSTIILLLTIFTFFCYTFFCCKSEGVKYLTVSQTNAIKGWAIIATYIHHYGQIRCEVYNAHSFLGYLGVALFLFLSGYIAEIQASNKEDATWKDKFWRKKFIRILVPKLIVVFAFGFIAGRSLEDNCMEYICFWRDWFLTAIMINFALFYFAKYFRVALLKTIFFGELMLVVACICTKQMIAWYNTAFLFGIGVWFVSHSKQVLNFFDRKRNLVLTIIICSLTLFCSIMRYQRFVFDTITGILFTFIFMYFVHKTDFESEFLNVVGKYSWEFYLIHARVIGIVLNRITTNSFLAFIVSFVISLVIAVGVNVTVNVCFNQHYREQLLNKVIALGQIK